MGAPEFARVPKLHHFYIPTEATDDDIVPFHGWFPGNIIPRGASRFVIKNLGGQTMYYKWAADGVAPESTDDMEPVYSGDPEVDLPFRGQDVKNKLWVQSPIGNRVRIWVYQ